MSGRWSLIVRQNYLTLYPLSPLSQCQSAVPKHHHTGTLYPHLYLPGVFYANSCLAKGFGHSDKEGQGYSVQRHLQQYCSYNRGGQFYLWSNQEFPKKRTPTCRKLLKTFSHDKISSHRETFSMQGHHFGSTPNIEKVSR